MATQSESSSEQSDVQCQEHGCTSPLAETDVVRSRTWSEDITRTWNAPVHSLESLEERKERYCHYFQLTSDQLKCIYDRFIIEMIIGLELHRLQPKNSWDKTKCSLKMMDACIMDEYIPRGREVGEALALDFGSIEPGTVHASHVLLQGRRLVSTSLKTIQLRDMCTDLPKGLLDKEATASQLFNALATLVKEGFQDVLKKYSQDNKIPIVLSVTFPIEQRYIHSGSLIHWTSGFETGRSTIDPVEGMDLVALLNCAFKRLHVPAEAIAVVNDTTATLLCSMYEKKPKSPPCAVAFVLGNGVNGCYLQGSSAQSYNYKSSIINCEVGNFEKSLPANDVDLEIDFAEDSTRGLQSFEKMVSTAYLGELCRRLVIKVFQSKAHALTWVRYSMPWFACTQVIMDTTEDMETTRKILSVLWDWESELNERKIVQDLFRMVFDRSAALVAVAIMALSSKTERLQPAMGGLTCTIGGSLFSKCHFYSKAVRSYLPKVLNNNTSDLIHIESVEYGASKGAGALCYRLMQCKNKAS